MLWRGGGEVWEGCGADAGGEIAQAGVAGGKSYGLVSCLSGDWDQGSLAEQDGICAGISDLDVEFRRGGFSFAGLRFARLRFAWLGCAGGGAGGRDEEIAGFIGVGVAVATEIVFLCVNEEDGVAGLGSEIARVDAAMENPAGGGDGWRRSVGLLGETARRAAVLVVAVTVFCAAAA